MTPDELTLSPTKFPAFVLGSACADSHRALQPSITVAVFRRVAALPLSVTPVFRGRLHGVTSFRPLLVTRS
jgi:hypothetical protein